MEQSIEKLTAYLNSARSVFHAVAGLAAQLEGEGYTYSIAGKGSFAAPRSDADRARRAELREKFLALAAELCGLGVGKEELCALIKEVSI